MKIVCDFATIYAQLSIIEEQIGEMDKAISKYQADIQTTLASWKGAAKDAFELTNEDQVTSTKTHVDDLREIVTFVKEAVKKIETLETELGNLKI